MNEVLTLGDIYSSKIYVQDGSALSFKHPEEYISPLTSLLERKDTDWENKLSIRTMGKVVNQNTDGNLNVSYPRVGLDYRYDTFKIDDQEFHHTLGFIYALDTKRPVMKVYGGIEASSCLNLCVFRAEQVFELDLFANVGEIYEKAQKYFEDTFEKKRFSEEFARLQESEFDDNSFRNKLGRLRESVNRNKTMFGLNLLGGAEKLMFNPTSKYYVGDDGKISTTEWNVFNSITQSISDDKEFITRPEKTLAAWKIYNN